MCRDCVYSYQRVYFFFLKAPPLFFSHPAAAVHAVDVFVGGRSGPDPKLAVKILEDVPCEKLPSVLEGLVPYHTREKMHRVRAGEARKAGVVKSVEKKEANPEPLQAPVPVFNPA